MKVRVYVRIARNTPSGRTRFKVEASPIPKADPLTTGAAPYQQSLHTVHFALDVTLPDDVFDPQKWPVIDVQLDEEAFERIAVEAVDPVLEATP